MSNALRKTLLQQLEQAEKAYNLELENGGPDTEQHRQQVAGLKRDLATLDTDEAARQEATEAEIESAMTELAETEVQAEKDRLHTYLSEQSDIPVPDITLPLNIAVGVQHSGRALQAAIETEAATKSEHDNLLQRFNNHESKRQTIVNRRAAGDGNDDADKADLLIAAEDMEGLRPLIDKALTALQQAQSASKQARVAFDQATSQWAAAVAAERDRCVLVMCEKAAAELEHLGPLAIKHAGMSLAGWRPSQELRQMVGRF